MLGRFVALLRGINVGGKNKLPMKLLASMFRDAGCLDLKTHIQSGNVVFSVDPDLAANLPERITARIRDELGFQAPITLRSIEEMATIVSSHSLRTQGLPETSDVMFLKDQPTPEQLATLDFARSLPDRFIVEGREVHLHLPNGVANTKLTNAYFDSRLKTISTIRNWRTTVQLLNLLRSEPA